MTDKELLIDAAKAAGIEYSPGVGGGIWIPANSELMREWNPLTDDGDALRLAVKLKLEIYHAWDEVTQVCVGYPNTGKHRTTISYAIESYTDTSIETATRRAIVLAAAEIGKAMP